MRPIAALKTIMIAPLLLIAVLTLAACQSAPPPQMFVVTSPETRTQAFRTVVAKEFKDASSMTLIGNTTMFRNGPVVGVSHDQETRKYYVKSKNATAIVTVDAKLDGNYLIISNVNTDYIDFDASNIVPMKE